MSHYYRVPSINNTNATGAYTTSHADNDDDVFTGRHLTAASNVGTFGGQYEVNPIVHPVAAAAAAEREECRKEADK